MKAKVFFILQRLKDGLYYHDTAAGEDWFVSTITDAHHFDTRQEAKTQIRELQNWLRRPKFKIITGQHITR